MSIRRRLLTLLVAVAGALAFVTGASADDDATGGPNNIVIVETTGAGPTQAVQASTQVASAASPTITSGNIAIAIASDCSGCHSTAVAVQVLLVKGSPTDFAPQNGAAAANGGCNGCGTYAYAWQYYVQTDQSGHLSAEAHQQIAQLRHEIADAAASIVPSDTLTDPCFVTTGPPFPCEPRDQQLDDKLNALTSELKSVVDSGIVEGGGAPHGTVFKQVDEAPGP